MRFWKELRYSPCGIYPIKLLSNDSPAAIMQSNLAELSVRDLFGNPDEPQNCSQGGDSNRFASYRHRAWNHTEQSQLAGRGKHKLGGRD